MEFYNKEFCIDVWGDYACFTRPEMKVERVSYDCITPSAARGIFEAIFWKPAIRWKIKKIEVLNPIKWVSVRRNEVATVISPRSKELFIEDFRQQKAGLFLRDVHYRLYADLEFVNQKNRPTAKSTSSETTIDQEEHLLIADTENPGKYNAIFERRARKGQCFNQPYLGCREFSAHFKFVDDPAKEAKQPVEDSRDLGFTLYDMDFTDKTNPRAMFFRPQMDHGTIIIPLRESLEVRK